VPLTYWQSSVISACHRFGLAFSSAVLTHWTSIALADGQLSFVEKVRIADVGKSQTKSQEQEEKGWASQNAIRRDRISGSSETIAIVNGESTASCTKKKSGKGECMTMRLQGAAAMLDAFEVQLDQYQITPQSKTGRFAGHSCSYYRIRSVMSFSLMGMTSKVTTKETVCMADKLGAYAAGLASDLVIALKGSKKASAMLAKITNEWKKTNNGFPLYSKSETVTKINAAIAMGAAGSIPEKTVTERTVLKVNRSKTDPSVFAIPPKGYQMASKKT
jgi:hypothetical protein